jgi:hypothetical protein
MSFKFEDQFSLPKEYYLNSLDFLNWYRFFYLVKDTLRLGSKKILEVGSGSGFVKSCLEPHSKKYLVMDINERLNPDILQDVREKNRSLNKSFDTIIIADVLEHLPFEDLEKTISNLYGYLIKDGFMLVTIPHRQSNFLFMSPNQIPRPFLVPTGFLSLGAFYRRFISRKIWIDPSHCWEIGDGKIKIKDVDKIFTDIGFKKVTFQKLIYVDYWILKRD